LQPAGAVSAAPPPCRPAPAPWLASASRCSPDRPRCRLPPSGGVGVDRGWADVGGEGDVLAGGWVVAGLVGRLAQLLHLALDVHQLAHVVAGLAAQRADAEVGEVQLLQVGLVTDLVEGALGGDAQLAEGAAELAGDVREPRRAATPQAAPR